MSTVLKRAFFIASFLLSGLFVSFSPGFSYDVSKMEADFAELVKLGNSVNDRTVRTSQVLSRALSSKGKPVFEFTVGQLEKIHGQISGAAGDQSSQSQTPSGSGTVNQTSGSPAVPQTGSVKPPITAEMLKPTDTGPKTPFQGPGAEVGKILQGKILNGTSGSGSKPPSWGSSGAPGKRGPERASGRPGKPGTAGSLIQKPGIVASTSGPAGNETISQYTERIENEAVQKAIDGRQGLEDDSERFREKCAQFAVRLMSPKASQARARFQQKLIEPRNRAIRWYFAGVAAMVAGHPDLENDPGAKKIDGILMDLQAESKLKAGKIDWDFTVAVAKDGPARKSLDKFASKRAERIKRADTSMAASGSAGAGPSRASRAGGKPRGKLKTSYWSNAWRNMWGDIGDHMQSNLDRGREYGQFAGEVVSLASGIKGAYGAMASNPVSNNIAHQIGKYAQDTAISEMGMGPPDPYSIVGHYAGGALGVFGGSIATAAGWVCGTIEAEWAQRGGSGGSRRSSGRGGATKGPKGAQMPSESEKILLFGN